MRENRSTTFLSLLSLVGLWIVATVLTDDPQVLPTPWSLFAPFLAEISNGELVYHLGHTLRRVIFAFALAMSVGMILGLIMGRSERINRWLDPWLVVFLNLPALVLIVLCYLWIGLTEMAAILAEIRAFGFADLQVRVSTVTWWICFNAASALWSSLK